MFSRYIRPGFLQKAFFRGFSGKNDLFGGIEEDLISKLDDMDQLIEKNGGVEKWRLNSQAIRQTSVIRSQNGQAQSFIVGFDEDLAYAISTDEGQIGQKPVPENGQFEDLEVKFPENSGSHSFESLRKGVNSASTKLNLSKPAPKLHPDKIVNATSQIFTGNIAVDYTNTIGEGNFVLIEGKPNTGKFTLCFNTAFNFLQDKGEYAAVVYFGLNRKDADQLSDLCSELGETYVFSPENPENNSSVYFNIQTAVKTALHLKQNKFKNVLFIVDNVKDIMIALEGISKDLGLNTTFSNPFDTLYDHSCVERGTKSSLTTLLNFEEIAPQDYYFVKLHKFYHNLISQADVQITTDLKKKSFRGVLPKIDLKIGNPYRFQWWLRELLLKIKENSETIGKMKEYGIHVDPWDAYLVYDSEYFLKLLISNRYLSWQEQIVVLYFVHKTVEDDLIPYFDRPQDEVISDLLEFCEQTKQFNDGTIYEYLDFVRFKSLPDSGEASQIDEQLSWLVEMFFFQQKDAGKLLQHKKDYM